MDPVTLIPIIVTILRYAPQAVAAANELAAILDRSHAEQRGLTAEEMDRARALAAIAEEAWAAQLARKRAEPAAPDDPVIGSLDAIRELEMRRREAGQ